MRRCAPRTTSSHGCSPGLDARALWETTTLVVVSDHGMVALGDVIDVEMLLADAGVEAEVVHGTAFAHVHLASDDEATRRAASEAIRAARLRVHAPTELPISLRYRVPGRTGDLVVLSDPPVALRPVRGLEEGWRRVASMLGNRTGGHGYDPSHPDMHAIFVAMGRGVPAGVRLGRVHATQVAPTVARLLGIDPPSRAEGEPIDALRVAPTPDATASAAPAAVPTP